MPFNTAAWLPAPRAALEVKPAPYTAPKENEIVVRARAVAINPVDWAIQAVGDMMFSWIKYPFVLGSDVAGEVAEVGKDVTRFKVGDRVLAHALWSERGRASGAVGAFQTYPVVPAHMASPIPAAISFESASVLPLALSTAACGLFQKDHLALDYPTTPAKPNGKTLIVWGGATSVGCSAIQLAAAAGYEVITTASPRNFDYVKSLGAAQVFDYNSRTVTKDIVAACKGKTLAGALAVGATAPGACLDIVHRCRGTKFVSMASYPISLGGLVGDGRGVRLRFLMMAPRFLAANLGLTLKGRRLGVGMKFIFGGSLAENEVGRIIYVDFLPGALAAGQFVPAPEPMVVGQGLAYVQAAFEAQRKGVSAKKVVVSLEG